MTTDQRTTDQRTTDRRTTHRPATHEVEVLPPTRCWSLLRETDLGRLAVVVGGHPEIFPITYAVDHGSIMFRSAGGTKLDGAVDHPVALEADAVDREGGTAWSVVVHGTARRVRGLHDELDALTLPLYPHHPGPKPHLVRIEVDRITGRVLPLAPRPADAG